MTARPARPWWRTWRGLLVPAILALAAIVFGISELPVAPVAPDATPIPNTAVGRLLEQIEMINFPTAQVGWAVLPTSPYWRVLRTTDAGARFQDVNPPGNASNGGLALTVMGPATAAVVFLAYQYIRDSTFAFTSDGGADWTAGILPNAASTGPDPIYVVSAHRIFAVLGNDTVVGTSDGGQSWATVALPSMPTGSCSPTSIWFTSPTSGWITGHCSGVAGLWHSSDGGQSWQAIVLSSSYAPAAAITVAPPDETTSAGVLVTVTASSGSKQSLRVFNDSSGSWLAAPALALPSGRLLVSFANAASGLVLVAPPGDKALALEYSTSSGGIDWSLRTTPIAADQVTALDLITPSHAVALAGAGRTSDLWSSTDGGASWSRATVSIFSGPIPRVNGITG